MNGTVKSESRKLTKIALRAIPHQSFVDVPSNKAIAEHFMAYGRVLHISRNGNNHDTTIVFAEEAQARNVLAVPEHVVNGFRFQTAVPSETSEKGAVKSRSANPVQLTLRPVSQRSVKKLPNDTIKEYFKQFGKFVRVKQNKEEVNVTLILRKGEEVAQKVFTVPEHVVNGVRLEVVGHLELPPLVVDPEEVRKFVKFKIETSKPLEQLPTDKVIRKHFKEFGVVTLCKRFPSSPHGQVRFKTAEQAELAVSASEHVVDGFVFKVGLCGRKGRSK